MWITLADLAPFADIDPVKAQAMIDDAEATAIMLVPALGDLPVSEFRKHDALRAILRRAILRWHEQGSGALTQQQETAGPLSLSWTADTRQTGSRGIFWPSEVAAMEEIVGANTKTAFSIDLAIPTGGNMLADRPDLAFQYDSLDPGTVYP